MDIIIWIIIVALFILSFIGIVMPVIPGVALIWLGFIIYNFGIEPITGWYFWASMVIITLVSLIADYLTSTTLVKKWGGSTAAKWSAVVGIILGPIIMAPIGMGPIGILIGPLLFVALVELIRGVPVKEALTIGLASLIGFLGGSVVKVILFIIMIIAFFIKVFI